MRTKITDWNKENEERHSMVDLAGYWYDNRKEYVNAPANLLPEDLIWLFLWRGERTPQNDDERKMAESFAKMHAQGIENVEFPFD